MRYVFTAFALILLLGPGGSAPNEEALWQHRNLGKAYFEDPVGAEKAVEEFARALALAPGSYREQLNYGIALLRAARLPEAIRQLESAQKLEPKLPNSWFNLGIAYKRAGRVAEAIGQFRGMVKLAPDEPISHYNLGLLYGRSGDEEGAIREFQEAARLNPRLVAPRFQIYNMYRLAERPEAAKALGEFERARAEMKAADEEEDVEWTWYSEIYDVIEPGERMAGERVAGDTPAPRFEDRRLAGKAEAGSAGVLVVDLGGDLKPDLLVWSRAGAMVFREGISAVAGTGLEGVAGVNDVAAGDWNNDGQGDLCLLTDSGVLLFRAEGAKYVREALSVPKGRFQRAVWMDYDHDYDADLFLLGPTPMLLRNQGPAGLAVREFPFVAGEVVDALAFRLTPDTKGSDLIVTFKDRPAVLYRDLLRGQYEAKTADGLRAGAGRLQTADVDHDGWMDVLSTAGILLNRKGSFENRPGPADWRLAADVGNRGTADVIAGGGVALNLGLGRFSASQPASGLGRAAGMVAADFNGDGWTDLAGVAEDGSVHTWLNRTNGANGWLAVSLSGLKNLKLATGTEVEVKSGAMYQKTMYQGVPMVVGLGKAAAVDTLRLTWANGNIQNVVHPELRRLLSVKEAPRLSGSCPMIFTWNGAGFEFLTDVLGVAPLGAGSGDGEVFPVDHDEYVSIPASALVERQGGYDLRVTEELREVSYIDQVKLMALDHPAGVRVLTNEKFKAPPFPEFRLYGVKREIAPRSARDEQGRDVRERVIRKDGRYADTFAREADGTARLHALELDFGPAAARGNRAVLVLSGWVDWADGSTFVGASQHGGLQLPSLEVRDGDGRWRTVVADMGIPAGKPKTMVVDLSGKFLSASREVRMVTNLCVYWDQIYLSEDVEAPEVKVTPLAMESAMLRFHGFSQALIDPERRQPETFVYSKLVAAPWDPTPGYYTRYGDVRGLLRGAGDELVIFGSGDEMALRFSGEGAPALPAGWQRDFLLLVDGWAKDSDANTVYSQSVDPVPFHGMGTYGAGRWRPRGREQTRLAGRTVTRLRPQ